MGTSRILLGFPALLLAFPACTSGIEPAPRDEACLQARYAVSAAQYRCGVDPQQANAAYDSFGATYRCIASAARTSDFECAERILDTPCDEAIARPADDPAYLGSAAACARLFARTDGAAFPLSTVPSKNPVCEQLAHRFAAPIKACSYAEAAQYSPSEDGKSADAVLREDIFAGRAKLDAGYTCLATDPAGDATACLEAIGCGLAVPPDDVLLAPGAPCAALLAPIAGATP